MKTRWPVWPLAVLTPLILAAALLVGSAGWADWRTEVGRAVLTLRLYRLLTGLLVGGGLAAAGAVMQAVLRNPLAEPYVLGVSSGAGLGAALAVAFGWSRAVVWSVPLLAFGVGLLTLVVVYVLAMRAGRASIYSLLLSGIIVSAMLANVLMLIVSIVPVEGMHSILWWMLGNLELGSRPLLVSGAVLVVVAVAALTAVGPQLNALTLGHDVAHHLGVRTSLVLMACLALATLLAATAVALAGLIGFVGLIVPHAARAWVGPDHRKLPAVSAWLGGLFLVLCDTLARTILAPQQIPIGVVTALVGGPFFLTLLLRRRQEGWVE